MPNRKKYMQYFFRKIDFICRFVVDFAEITKSLKTMIKKEIQFKWTPIKKDNFKKVKASIATTQALHNPQFIKYL